MRFTPFRPVSQQRVGAVFYHFGDVGISRAAVWRVVLDTTIFRRVVGRGDHNAVRQRTTFFVVHQNSVGDRRRWGEAVVFLHDHVDAVGRQHFQHRNKRRFGEGVGIFAHIARTGDRRF